MSEDHYLVSIAGGFHRPGAVIWGPFTRDMAADMVRVSANPFRIVHASEMTDDQRARARR